MEQTVLNNKLEDHSIIRSIVLSLLPGFPITLVICIASELLLQKGLPAQLAVYIPTLLVILPFELGYLLYLGKKNSGKLSLDGIIQFKNRIPTKQYLIFVPIFTIWNFLIFYLMAPFEKFFIEKLFYWMPSGLLPSLNPMNDLLILTASYPKFLIILFMSIGLLLNGIATPLVEELYFRGYLLPRLSYLKHWAPFLNVLLFSLYHIFSPWKYLTIILALFPAVYMVWKTKTIYLTIITHILLNTIGLGANIFYLLTML